MFMFRSSRRNALLKRLWRSAAVRALKDQPREDASSQQQVTQATHSKRQMQLKAHALFKRLSEEQLQALVAAVESGGACPSPCLHSDCPIGQDPPSSVAKSGAEPAHLLLCRMFRWPELRSSAELKRINTLCTAGASSSAVCCNPYHWSRLSPSDVAPPPYSRLAMTLDRPGRLSVPPPPAESLETGGTNQYSSSNTNLDGSPRPRPWCTLAYWELRQRVGRLFPVTQPSVAIFSEAKVQDTGLCLSALTSQVTPETEAVRRTRQKVGHGLLLCQESDGVWLYNRSENAIFVNSPTLDPPGPGPAGAPRTLLVYKVPPGFAIRIFDYDRSQFYQQLATLTSSESPSSFRPDGSAKSLVTETSEVYSDGPFDPNALRISFAKGWGPKYSRQFITSCPCWIEVLLAPPCR